MIFKPKLLDKNLHDKGFVRQHVRGVEDSLFRCLAEVIYHTQPGHQWVRQDCVKYFEALESDDPQLKRILEQLAEEDTPGTLDVVGAASKIYKREIWVYREEDSGNEPLKFPCLPLIEPQTVTNNRVIRLSLDIEGHFDIVYSFREMKCRAMAQSIVYHVFHCETLGLSETELRDMLDKMLKEKYYSRLKNQRKRLGTRLAAAIQEGSENTNASNENGNSSNLMAMPPMPYKTAKALDPHLYRNTQMDIWLSEIQKSQNPVDQGPFIPGTKCYIQAEEETHRKLFSYVQQLLPDDMAQVFIYPLGKSVTVPLRSLVKAKVKQRRPNDPRRWQHKAERAFPSGLLGDAPPVFVTYAGDQQQLSMASPSTPAFEGFFCPAQLAIQEQFRFPVQQHAWNEQGQVHYYNAEPLPYYPSPVMAPSVMMDPSSPFIGYQAPLAPLTPMYGIPPPPAAVPCFYPPTGIAPPTMVDLAGFHGLGYFSYDTTMVMPPQVPLITANQWYPHILYG